MSTFYILILKHILDVSSLPRQWFELIPFALSEATQDKSTHEVHVEEENVNFILDYTPIPPYMGKTILFLLFQKCELYRKL